MHNWKRYGALILSGALAMGSCLSVSAEENAPAGYHVYETEEDYSSDTWYGIARGDHLSTVNCSITKVDSTHVKVSGNTYAHHTCNRVYVRVYLDQSTDAKNWSTLDYWTTINENATTAHVESESYKVPTGYYYCAQGAHSVTKGSVTEATDTGTNAIKL